MFAGDLDRRITIERATLTRNAFGEDVPGPWLALATVWASKKDIRDAERFAAQEVAATITTRFQIRWSAKVADVNPKDRVRYAERLYNIVAVKEIDRRVGLEITAAARAD